MNAECHGLDPGAIAVELQLRNFGGNNRDIYEEGIVIPLRAENAASRSC